IGQGDRVALWLPNTPAWLALYFACAWLGAIASRSTPASAAPRSPTSSAARERRDSLPSVPPPNRSRPCARASSPPSTRRWIRSLPKPDDGVSLSGLYGMSEVQALFAPQRPEAQPSRSAHEQQVMPLVGFFCRQRVVLSVRGAQLLLFLDELIPSLFGKPLLSP